MPPIEDTTPSQESTPAEGAAPASEGQEFDVSSYLQEEMSGFEDLFDLSGNSGEVDGQGDPETHAVPDAPAQVPAEGDQGQQDLQPGTPTAESLPAGSVDRLTSVLERMSERTEVPPREANPETPAEAPLPNYTYTIGEDLNAVLGPDSTPQERMFGFQAVMRGVSEGVHREIRKEMEGRIQEAVTMAVSQAVSQVETNAKTSEAKKALHDRFYGTYSTLDRPAMKSHVEKVAQEMAKSKAITDLSDDSLRKIAEKAAADFGISLEAVAPAAAPPAPKKPPRMNAGATPRQPNGASTHLDPQQEQMMDLLS